MFHFENAKALVFDLMGTCCDWHSSLVPALLSCPVVPGLDLSKLAAEWRAGFFDEIKIRFARGAGQEDIDITHRRVLDRLLYARNISLQSWDNATRDMLVAQWHYQRAWPDALPGLARLRQRFFAVVLANGSTRLQLDILKSSRLPFHTAFSSQLLGFTKPNPAIYRKAMDLMQLQPQECIMVASHAYDLRAAKEVGMKTIYIHRATEDLNEDMDRVRQEVDFFLDGTAGTELCGLMQLANLADVLSS